MNFAIYIARRYLISKKSRNAINIISLISVLGVATGTAALVIILSVFNGFEDLIKRLNNSFDPDIKIEAVYGKTFKADSSLIKKIELIDFVEAYSFCLEESAMLQYDDNQMIATIKGVDENFINVSGLDTMIVSGEFIMEFYGATTAVIGRGISYNLQVHPDFSAPISIYVPSRTRQTRGNFSDAADNLNRIHVYAGGIFAIQQEYDSKYVLLPIDAARDLLEYDNDVSSLELKLKPGTSSSSAVKQIESVLGEDFSVKDRNRQHEYAYKIMKAEKWTIFMILIFILLIASFNVIGSLTMLIIDKKADIIILKSMGADNSLIRKIFFYQGVFICLAGAIAGVAIGALVSWTQMKYGIVSLGTTGSFIIDAYPVFVKPMDILYIFVSVMIIGVLAAWYPVRYITKRFVSVDY
jgi:lipoprotein-releasing system permease protein